MQIIPFTKQGYEELEKELEKVVSQRPAAVKELTRGRDMGDLSENGLYKAAKQNLVDIDRQIRHLKI
jgi:transcription elongation factor GreA